VGVYRPQRCRISIPASSIGGVRAFCPRGPRTSFSPSDSDRWHGIYVLRRWKCASGKGAHSTWAISPYGPPLPCRSHDAAAPAEIRKQTGQPKQSRSATIRREKWEGLIYVSEIAAGAGLRVSLSVALLRFSPDRCRRSSTCGCSPRGIPFYAEKASVDQGWCNCFPSDTKAEVRLR